MRPALAIILALALSACQTIRYDIDTVVGGEPTHIGVTKTYPGWTEMSGSEINLATGVDPDGNWYIYTGDALQTLTQNPAVANAIVQGVVTGLADAFKSGLFAP